MPTSQVEIDLRAVDHNVRLIRSILAAPDPQPGSDGRDAPALPRAPVALCAVLKQDAYGLGAARIAKRLTLPGAGVGPPVEMIAVFALDEVRDLAGANVNTPVLVLMPVRDLDRTDPTYRVAAAGRLHLTLHDPDQLSSLERLVARLGFSIPVHIFVDTGMGRGGALPEVATEMVRRIVSAPGGGAATASGARIRLAGVMTHFAGPCSDAAFTREQARQFREWASSVRDMLPNQGAGLALHAANTCGMFRSQRYHGTMVRVGQSIFGYALDDGADADTMEFAEAARALRPAVRWTSGIVHVKEVPPGFPVGYGGTWHAPTRRDGRPSKIALVPVGYADGYPRSLSNVARVGLSGRRWDARTGAGSGAGAAGLSPGGHEPLDACAAFAPVVGRVSMDQFTIDVTDVPSSLVFVGAEVELAGTDRDSPNFLPRVAADAGTITHEFLCRIGPRVERVHRVSAAGAVAPSRAAERGGGGLTGAAAVA